MIIQKLQLTEILDICNIEKMTENLGNICRCNWRKERNGERRELSQYLGRRTHATPCIVPCCSASAGEPYGVSTVSSLSRVKKLALFSPDPPRMPI